MRDLTLETGDGTRLVSPSNTQIREVLMGLHGANTPFAILGDPQSRFVKVYGSHVDGFSLEYCPERGASVRQVDPSPVPLDVALRVFEAVRAGEARPLGDLVWHTARRAPKTEPKQQPVAYRMAKPWASGWLIVAGIPMLGLSAWMGSALLQKMAMSLVAVYFLGTAFEGIDAGRIRGRYQWIDRHKDPLPFWVFIGLCSLVGVGIMIALAF